MIKKISFFSIILAIFLILGYFLLKNYISPDLKQVIKKYILPYKVITNKEKIISERDKDIIIQKDQINSLVFKTELYFKQGLGEIKIKKNDNVTLENNLILKNYEIVNGFYSGINNKRPGGYLDFHNNNLLILSSRGILAYSDNFTGNLYFKQIKNNINEFINLAQFERNSAVSLRDLYVFENEIYISFVDEIKLNCWNISIIRGEMNYQDIKFSKLFSFDKCDGSNNPKYANQTGGRIVNYDENHILLSVGVLGDDHLAQDKNSIKGKVIKINTENSDYEIISMGHRNPQGLFYDKEKNLILEVEHGPRGGDEINLIEINKLNKDDPFNFGWAIVSAGEHYCHRNFGKEKEPCATKYKNFPLHKSHKKYGFIEPLRTFVPSIAPSEITKIDKNSYVLGTMGANKEQHKSLYFFQLNDEKKMINLQQVKVFKRVRDLVYKNEVLYLLFEEPSSIGVVSLKQK